MDFYDCVGWMNGESSVGTLTLLQVLHEILIEFLLSLRKYLSIIYTKSS